MFGTLIAVSLLCAVALLLGQALCVLCRGATAWYGGAIGGAALVVLASLLIRLPGDAVTSAAVIGLLTAASAALLVARRALHVPAIGLAVAGITLAATLIPFLANARFGLLGVSFNNDTSLHMLWAEGLRDDFVRRLAPSPGAYPLGPHAVAATLAQSTGLTMDVALDALLMATPVLTALAAVSALRESAPLARIITGPLAGLSYLAVSYYAEGAFKETLMAAFVLTFAVVLDDVVRRGVRARHAILLALPAAGMLYSYSYLGLVWPAAAGATWLVMDVGARLIQRGRAGAERRVRTLTPAGGLAIVTLALVGLPELRHALDFFHAVGGGAASVSGGAGGIAANSLGNLNGPLPLFEAFGIWLGPDYRLTPPGGPFDTGVLAALAAAVTGYGLLSLIRRGEYALPATLMGAGAVYLVSRHQGESPYVTAKALAIAGPLAMTVACAGLWRPLPRIAGGWEIHLARAGAIVVFTLAAGLSSFYALRGAQVAPPAHQEQLAALRPILARSPTLYLGYDDYYAWKLRGVPAAQAQSASPIPVEMRPEKQWSYEQPFDFDTIQPTTLDRFAYVITPRTAYASETPTNFRLVRRTQSFLVWRRTGPTPTRATLPAEGAAPGARLDCTKRSGRELAAAHGVARVMPAPISIAGPATGMLTGHSVSLPLRLPPGRWDLSLPYASPQDVTVRLPGLRATLPASLDRPGPSWYVGSITVPAGAPPMRLTISIAAPAPRLLRSEMHVAYLGNLLATRADVARRTVPLSHACGRYVDWYAAAT